MLASISLLAIFGFTPISNVLILPLENRFPVWNENGPPEGVIVLGGAIGPELSAARGTPGLNESAERITAVAALARQYSSMRIIYSGGSGMLFGGLGEADFVLPLWESFGIARERVMLEDQSRNTQENAIFSKVLAAPKPGEKWLLVTSAAHMPRAVGVFRKAGFPVEAYPVDWRTRGDEDMALPFRAFSAGLARTDAAFHEWVGLVAYWLTGKTDALFPAP